MYEIDVTDVTTPPIPAAKGTINTNSTVTTSDTAFYNDWQFTSPYTYSWNYTTVVYKYQLICPRCKTTNWGEIDQVVTCSGKIRTRPCKATFKAINKAAPVDFEIPVG